MSWFHNILSMVAAWHAWTDAYQLTYYSDSIIWCRNREEALHTSTEAAEYAAPALAGEI